MTQLVVTVEVSLAGWKEGFMGYDNRCKDCRYGQCSTCKGEGTVWGTFGSCTKCHGRGGTACASHR
jgi:hypothetical protein